MFNKVLDCPKCSHRFGFDYDQDIPEHITCPSCGCRCPASDYSVLTFCSNCRTKLKIPLELVNEPDIECPKCGSELHLDEAFITGADDSTFVPDMKERNTRRMLQDGEFFDKYKIIRLLGRGGMAEVYLAEHLLLKQQCAIKLMAKNANSENPVFIKRFLREAQLAHTIKHPNIVKVYDAGNDFKTGHLYLAMEYVEGNNLLEIARQDGLSEKDLWDILIAMASALNLLYEQKVVHRDIKPSNIMKTNYGVYKLMDLGIAKAEVHQKDDITLTMEQTSIGTPAYASPEQCQSAHNVDIRADIYSLGATIYHLASGKLPFSGTTSVEIILRVVQEEPEPLEKLRPDLSPKMLTLVKIMMSKKKEDRPSSPQELLDYIYDKKKLSTGSERNVKNFFFNVVLKNLSTIFNFAFLIGCIVLIILAIPYFFVSDEKAEASEKKQEKKETKPVKVPPRVKYPYKKVVEKSFFRLLRAVSFYYNSATQSYFIQSMVSDGTLIMDGYYPARKEINGEIRDNRVIITELNNQNFSFSATFYSEVGNKHLISFGKENSLSLFIISGELYIGDDEKAYPVRFTVPRKKWFNVDFSYDGYNCFVYINGRFYGKYPFTRIDKFNTRQFSFYDTLRKTALNGQVRKFYIYNGQRYKSHPVHGFKLPEAIKVKAKNEVAKTDTPAPAATIQTEKNVTPVPAATVQTEKKEQEKTTERIQTVQDKPVQPSNTVKTSKTNSVSGIFWHTDYSSALKESQEKQKPLMIFFSNSSYMSNGQRIFEQINVNPADFVKLYINTSVNFVTAEQRQHNTRIITKYLSELKDSDHSRRDLVKYVGNTSPYYLFLSHDEKVKLLGRQKSTILYFSYLYYMTYKKKLSGEKIVVRTPKVRYKECKARLEQLNKEPDSGLKRKKIAFINEQIEKLSDTQRYRNSIAKRKMKGYSRTKTDGFKEKLLNYQKTYWLSRDINLSTLFDLLNDNSSINPDIYITTKMGELKSVIDIFSVNHSNLTDSRIEKLKELYVDPDFIFDIYSLQKFGLVGRTDIDHTPWAVENQLFFVLLEQQKNFFVTKKFGRIYEYTKLMKEYLLSVPDLKKVKDKSGRNPMHYAAMYNLPDLINDLVYAGFSDKDAVDEDGLTPWQYALRTGSSDAVSVLKLHGLTTQETEFDRIQYNFWQSLKAKNYTEMTRLLHSGADPYCLTENSLNAIQYACAKNNLTMVQALIMAGVNPNRNDIKNRSMAEIYHPLFISYCCQNYEIFSYLLKHGTKYPTAFVFAGRHLANFIIDPYISHYMRNIKDRWNADKVIPYLGLLKQYGWNMNDIRQSFYLRRFVNGSNHSNQEYYYKILVFLLENGLKSNQFPELAYTQNYELKKLVEKYWKKDKNSKAGKKR